MRQQSIFAGDRLRRLRNALGLRQGAMAGRLGISVSYLSQLEHDHRPLTPALLALLVRDFPLDWEGPSEGSEQRRVEAVHRAFADPLFGEPLDRAIAIRLAQQRPQLADRFVSLHTAYRQ